MRGGGTKQDDGPRKVNHDYGALRIERAVTEADGNRACTSASRAEWKSVENGSKQPGHWDRSTLVMGRLTSACEIGHATLNAKAATLELVGKMRAYSRATGLNATRATWTPAAE